MLIYVLGASRLSIQIFCHCFLLLFGGFKSLWWAYASQQYLIINRSSASSNTILAVCFFANLNSWFYWSKKWILDFVITYVLCRGSCLILCGTVYDKPEGVNEEWCSKNAPLTSTAADNLLAHEEWWIYLIIINKFGRSYLCVILLSYEI